MTQSGEVAGFLGAQGERIWLGVPYAAPPVGLLRWRAPQPPLSWSGPRFTVEHAQPSVQRSRDSDGGPIYIGSEDCLYLNIWAPPDRQKSAEAPGLRPVMFWIHGGGNCYDTGIITMARSWQLRSLWLLLRLTSGWGYVAGSGTPHCTDPIPMR